MGLSANGIGFLAASRPTGIFGTPFNGGGVNSPLADGEPPNEDNDHSWFDPPDPGEIWDSIVSTVSQAVSDTVERVVDYVTPQVAPWGSTNLTTGTWVLDAVTSPNPVTQNPVPIMDDVLTVLPVVKPLANLATNATVSALAPNNPDAYKTASDQVYATAQQAQQMVENGEITDLQGFQMVLTEAAEQSDNDPDGFMQLMNETVVGYKANEPGNGWSFYDVPENREPINFGDTGVDPEYQDHSSNQLSYHYWAYVNQGHMGLGLAGTYLNWSHEKGACGESIEDFDIGVLGQQMGEALRNGDLTPEEFAEQFPEYLGTDEHASFQFVTSLLDRDEESPLNALGATLVLPSANDADYVSCEQPAVTTPAADVTPTEDPYDAIERIREREERLEAAEADDIPPVVAPPVEETPEDITPSVPKDERDDIKPEVKPKDERDDDPPASTSSSTSTTTTASTSSSSSAGSGDSNRPRRHGGEVEMI